MKILRGITLALLAVSIVASTWPNLIDNLLEAALAHELGDFRSAAVREGRSVS
jgi:hypothetical protein